MQVMKRRTKLPSQSPARQSTALRRTACFTLAYALVITVCPALDLARATATERRPPNIVLIMTDNHGAWTLGCYGNPEIRTPHIDRLAESGAKFNHVYANNGVCSPTRASFLTGLMPSQHGVHRFIAANVMTGERAYNTIEEFKSLPDIFSQQGYSCGLVGKWHLGDHLHPQEGFSSWITKRGGHTPSFYNDEIIQDGKRRREPGHLTPFWTRHAKKFIHENKDRPFFLFLAYNGPYSLGTAILPEPKNRHAAYYSKLPMNSFPRAEMHPWMWSRWQKPHLNNITSMRNTASQISLIDDGVGEITRTLAEHGLEENTLVIFTADQGFAGGHGGFWGMGDHTRPLTAREECMHIPLIMRHSGRIEAGTTFDQNLANYDVYPSLLHYLGLADQIPENPPRPGRNFAPLLANQSVAWDDTVFYELENVRVIRSKGWKYIERIGDPRHELYDLTNDAGESQNLYADRRYAKQRQDLQNRLRAFFERYSTPRWNLWTGGAAKGGLLLGTDPYQDRVSKTTATERSLR